MLNAQPLNTAMLNSPLPLPSALTAADFEQIEFNGYGLQNTNIITSEIKAWSAPARQITSYRTPRGDGGGVVGAYLYERRVRVSGIIKADTSDALEDALDELKKNVIAKEAELVMTVKGTVRRIKATLENTASILDGRESYHITFCPFALEFVSSEPLFTSLDYQTQTAENVALLNYIFGMDNEGTYRAPLVTVMIVEAASAVTGLTLTCGNGEVITLTNALVAGDVVVIDGENKSLTVNGVEKDYVGAFPAIETGLNDLTLAVAGTSVQYSLTTKYRKAYL